MNCSSSRYPHALRRLRRAGESLMYGIMFVRTTFHQTQLEPVITHMGYSIPSTRFDGTVHVCSRFPGSFVTGAFVHGRRESAVFQCPESRVFEGTQVGNALYSRLPNAGTLRFRRVPVLGL